MSYYFFSLARARLLLSGALCFFDLFFSIRFADIFPNVFTCIDVLRSLVCTSPASSRSTCRRRDYLMGSFSWDNPCFLQYHNGRPLSVALTEPCDCQLSTFVESDFAIQPPHVRSNSASRRYHREAYRKCTCAARRSNTVGRRRRNLSAECSVHELLLLAGVAEPADLPQLVGRHARGEAR